MTSAFDCVLTDSLTRLLTTPVYLSCGWSKRLCQAADHAAGPLILMKYISGKLVIITIVAVAVTAAGASWWFRYAATHRAVQFWGPDAARLIRDAPSVHLVLLPAAEPRELVGEVPIEFDISHARGLTHLRHALLEDRSFDWSTPSDDWRLERDFVGRRALEFRGGKFEGVTILFSADWRQAAALGDDQRPQRIVSTQPIAEGLATMFAEFLEQPPAAR